MKKTLSIILTIVVIFTSMFSVNIGSNTAFAATSVWNGKVDTSWYTGDKDSYDIYTAEQLAGLAQLADTAAHEDRFNGVTINLMADIVLNDTKDFKNWDKKPPKNTWEPIGNTGGAILGYNPFAGVFNGNGHTITGMYCKNDEYGFLATTSSMGFFECICGATITNLKFNKAYVHASGCVGVLVGVSESSFISGVEVKNSNIYCMDGKAGGIIGSCHQFVNTYLLTSLLLLGMGIAVNPILYADEFADEVFGEHGSVLCDCKVDNISIEKTKSYESGVCGGAVGGGRVGICNTVVSHLTVNKAENLSGVIVGADPKTSEDVAFKNCSYYSCSIKNPASDSAKKFVDIKSAKNLKKNTKIKVGAKKASLTVKNKKANKINLKCSTNSTSKLKYKVAKTPKNGKKYCKVTASGIVKLKKNCPKGTYKISVSAAENNAYTAAKKTISIKVKK